ncbi:hypothetical protein V6Z12_D09G033700 [Gossypium hirsutum]
MEVTKLRLVLLFYFAMLISRLWENVTKFDDFWKQREKEARKLALKAYEPSPENITNHLNYNVNKGKHKKYNGPCLATNPIDRCWQCMKNWVEDRKRLANCVLGFGHKTRDNSDNGVINPKPGTLLHAVIQKKQLWIIFAHDMNIKLSEELIVQSEKTIDGRRASVHIAYGCDITLQFVLNVIIHNVHVHHVVESRGGLIRDSIDHFGFRAFGDRDGISIFGSSNIWLDHISIYHFIHHNNVILFGARFIHVVNNDYTHWEMYAIGGSTHPTIISQGNRFIAPNDPFAKEITHVIYALESKWKNWVWRSEGDLFMNGAFFRTSKPSSSFQFTFNKKDMIEAKPGTFVGRLTHFVGALNCKKNLILMVVHCLYM